MIFFFLFTFFSFKAHFSGKKNMKKKKKKKKRFKMLSAEIFTQHAKLLVFTVNMQTFFLFTCTRLVLTQFNPSGVFYHTSLDQSIYSVRGVWSVFIITMYYWNACILCNQCRTWSDAAFCGVWSGSTLFAKVPFIERCEGHAKSSVTSRLPWFYPRYILKCFTALEWCVQ